MPQFPYLYKFSGGQGPSEKETLKKMSVLPGQGSPSAAPVLHKLQGGWENGNAIIWGPSASEVHLGQVQENYLQPEKVPMAPSRNLITLFMTTQAAKDQVPLLCQMAKA